MDMANRADRRRMMREQVGKNAALMMQYDKAQRRERLMQQGISPEDLKKADEDGFQRGYKAAAIPTIQGCYAAVGLALAEEFGFDQEQCIRAINAVDSRIVTMISFEDMRLEALDKLDIDIRFEEGVDRIGIKR